MRAVKVLTLRHALTARRLSWRRSLAAISRWALIKTRPAAFIAQSALRVTRHLDPGAVPIIVQFPAPPVADHLIVME